MTGLERELRDKILGFNPHVDARELQRRGSSDWQDVVEPRPRRCRTSRRPRRSSTARRWWRSAAACPASIVRGIDPDAAATA